MKIIRENDHPITQEELANTVENYIIITCTYKCIQNDISYLGYVYMYYLYISF